MKEANIETTMLAWHCMRCNYVWPKKSELPPVRCARCKSSYWQRPRKVKPVPHTDPAKEYMPNV